MRALKVDNNDNVAVVAQTVSAGDEIQVGDGFVTAVEPIQIGHKIALCDIPCGEMVIKYGVPIGKASCDIAKGSHVHTQNVEDITEELCREYADAFKRKAGAAL